jgi:hypothetical protein
MTLNSRQRHLITGVIIVIALVTVVVSALGFAHAWFLPKEEDAPRCFETFATSQFPKWLGCAMAAHENLAGGLIGAAGALFAAWVAFTTVQRQMDEEKAQRENSYVEAKLAAVTAITQPIHAAASTFWFVRRILASQPPPINADDWQSVSRGIGHVDVALNSFVLREVARDLRVDDRVLFIALISALTTLVNLSKGPKISPPDQLRSQQRALESLGRYLPKFDADLASVFERDSAL